jgi:CheY-like chemotaxis protein
MRTATFKIIAVEDDADDRMLLDEAFKEIKYEADVKKLADGDLLFDYLGKIDKELYPSLIILDNSLPKKTAMDILLQLKENVDYRHIPVVIYSTLVSPLVKEQLLAAGAFACLKKGDAMQEIVETAKWFRQIAEAQAAGDELSQLYGAT